MYKLNGKWTLTDKEVEVLADYIIKDRATIRETANLVGISKTTLHSILHKRLPDINYVKYMMMQSALENNFSVKHVRGGKATARKWAEIKKKKK